MDLKDFVKGDSLRVLAKPGAKRTEILGYDESRKALRIAVAAPADKNKANEELLKFVSRHLKRRVAIKTGATSKEKLLKLL